METATMKRQGVNKLQNHKVREFMNSIAKRNENEPEFLQAVQEVAEVIVPFIDAHPKYQKAKILERITEPERVIMFRVPWLNDKGEVDGLIEIEDNDDNDDDYEVEVKDK